VFGPDEDHQTNKRPAGSRVVAGGDRTTAVAFFGTTRGGGLAEKENEANESRGADVLVMLLLSSLT
jgi:hypothetical protein